MPGQVAGSASEQGEVLTVQQGADVRVTLTNGQVIAGKVIRISDREIVVESMEDIGLKKHTISSVDIQHIDLELFDHSEEKVAKTTALFFVVVAVGLVAFAYSLRGLGD
ncbi:MAG: hypothetical protein QNL91_00675 [Candidatus Krumholzibacteria bacterium]|nr:hypothetical protein [Candidatus Krumholzibacteria bacterium]